MARQSPGSKSSSATRYRARVPSRKPSLPRPRRKHPSERSRPNVRNRHANDPLRLKNQPPARNPRPRPLRRRPSAAARRRLSLPTNASPSLKTSPTNGTGRFQASFRSAPASYSPDTGKVPAPFLARVLRQKGTQDERLRASEGVEMGTAERRPIRQREPAGRRRHA